MKIVWLALIATLGFGANIQELDSPCQLQEDRNPVSMNGYLYYSTGYTLCKSNGSDSGTEAIASVALTNCAPDYIFGVVNGKLLFECSQSGYGNELWATDGTTAGTYMVKDIYEGILGSLGNGLGKTTIANGRAFFWANDGTDDGISTVQIWASDGTADGTVKLNDANVVSGTYDIKTAGNLAYFRARSTYSGGELWCSDGTRAGTHMVEDLYETTADVGSPDTQDNHITLLGELNGQMMFAAEKRVIELIDERKTQTYYTGIELFKTGGSGATLVKDINMQSCNQQYYCTGQSYPRNGLSYNGRMIFSAHNGVGNSELYITDGSEEGTYLVKDINPSVSSSIDPHCAITDRFGKSIFFFSANDGTYGREYWRTDGTEGGTYMLEDIAPDSSPGSSASNHFGATCFNNTFFARGIIGTSVFLVSGKGASLEILDANIDSLSFAQLNNILFMSNDDKSYYSKNVLVYRPNQGMTPSLLNYLLY